MGSVIVVDISIGVLSIYICRVVVRGQAPSATYKIEIKYEEL
jgi:hypothetical protein